jgi:D-3-phosphoglycerate dehydrogenase
MRKPEILLTGPFSEAETAALKSDYLVHQPWLQPNPEAYLADVAPSIRAIATTGTLGASLELMQSLPALELVATFGVGVDAIDLDYARLRGIRVTNTPDVLTDDVADLAIGLLLAVSRKIAFGDRWVRDGRWPKGPMPLTTSLAGKTLGILGLGRIGRAIASRAKAFGMEILYTARSSHADVAYGFRPTPIELARDCDSLVISAAGGPETRGIVDGLVLRALGPQGFVVNIARGSLIDEPALISALMAGEIAGAALDVFWDEPDINPAFARLDNVVLQPHAGSGTDETRAAIGRLMRANLAAHFAGEPLITPFI